MEIVQQAQDWVSTFITIYGPAIITIITSILTAVTIVVKFTASIKSAKQEFAKNEEVVALTKDVKNLKDHVIASDKENRELKQLLKKEIAARTKIEEK